MNRIPFINKLKLREVVCFRGLWGNLTEKTIHTKILRKKAFSLFLTVRMKWVKPLIWS